MPESLQQASKIQQRKDAIPFKSTRRENKYAFFATRLGNYTKQEILIRHNEVRLVQKDQCACDSR